MWGRIFFDNNGIFIWSSIAAIIALFGSVTSIIFSWLSYSNSKKIAESQRKMEQKKIDADLKAKARIKWIEDVRQNSANLLKDLSNLQSYSLGENLEVHDNLVRDSELLMLYFSSNKFTEPSEKINIVRSMPGDESSYLILRIDNDCMKILSNTKSNESKNTLIKALIINLIDLFKKVDVYKKIELKRGIERKYKDLSSVSEDLYSMYMSPNDSQAWQNLNDEIYLTLRELSYFREIISIYLKIEWDRAKQGK